MGSAKTTARPSTGDRFTRVTVSIVFLLFCTAFLAHFNRINIRDVADKYWIRDGFGITEQGMGQVYSAFLIAYTLCMLPAGWLIDRWGTRRTLAFMGWGMGTCVVLTGCLGWLGWRGEPMWWGLLLVRSVAGMLSAPLHPAAARCVRDHVPIVRRTIANGVVTAGALLGISATPWGFGMLMDHLGWPTALAVSGVAMIGLATVWRLSVPSPLAADEASSLSISGRLANGSARDEGSAVRLLWNWHLLALSLSYAAVSYFQYLFFYWMPLYFTQAFALPESINRRNTTFCNLAMALGMVVGGVITDWSVARWGLVWGRRGVVMAGMILSGMSGIAGANAHDPTSAAVAFAFAFAAIGACEGVFWTTVTEVGRSRSGSAAAILNTWGNGIGALAPAVTPWISHHFGWSAAIRVACGISVLGGLLWLTFDPRGDETVTASHDRP